MLKENLYVYVGWLTSALISVVQQSAKGKMVSSAISVMDG
jgi:hypothetical protein